MASFADQLRAFNRRTGNKVDRIVSKIVFDVGTALVMKTPVGDPDYWIRPAPPGYVGGRARGNWQYGLGAPSLDQGGIDPSGGVAIGRIVGKIDPKAGDKVHYITNTLDYVKRLEEGYSRQAPNGMVALTVQEFDPIVRAAARALSR